MQVNQSAPAPTGTEAEQAIGRFLTDSTEYFDYSYSRMMSVSRDHLDWLHTVGLKKRFEHFRGRLPMLDRLADAQNISAIQELNDVLPLLFDHATYKSYPPSLLDKHRFGQLTAWLNKLTTHDLSGIDVSTCRGVDDWMIAINTQSPLAVIHTSGTTGTMSFLPWSKDEFKKYAREFVSLFESTGPQATPLRPPLNIDCVNPYFRSGGYGAGPLNDAVVDIIAGGEERFHAAYPGRLSADLTLFAARRRAAIAKGQLDRLEIGPELAARHAEFESQQRNMPGFVATFLTEMRDRLAGKRVFMVGTTGLFYALAESGLKQGLRKLFSPDSITCFGGGGKGMILPDNHAEVIREFLGVDRVTRTYGMSEMTGQFPMCEHEHYHVTPWIIPFLLDPETDRPLPRSGRVTGRFAFYDLQPETRWGGFVTGDEVTIEWDKPCPCGRTTAYLEMDIHRVNTKRDDGEEKINCAASPAAYAEALDFLRDGTQ